MADDRLTAVPQREHYYVSVSPGMMWGRPVVGRYRMLAAQVAEMWWFHSYTLESMREEWPELTRPAVLVACWYMAVYGSRPWKKRWGEWANVHWSALWHADYDDVPMPPQEGNTVKDA